MEKNRYSPRVLLNTCVLALLGILPFLANADEITPSPQGVCPPFFLLDEDGKVINPIAGENAGKPYSPKQTCGKCHDYARITEGFHFTQGAGEKPTDDQEKRTKWVLTPGNYGGNWCSPSPLYRFLSAKQNSNVAEIDMTSFGFITAGCADCHPGGGPMEFDRDGNRYDDWMEDPNNGLVSGGENHLDGDYYKARWSETGVLEADCLLCHLPEYNYKGRNSQIKNLNFRWAPTVGAGLASISGSIINNETVTVQYDLTKFEKDGKISPHIVREPRSETCLNCHAKPGWKKRGANFRARTDVHLRAGLKCVDCHSAGSQAFHESTRGKEIHQFGKGDDPGGHVRDDLDNTMRDCADCHNSGYLGAPLAKHPGLPPLHLEKIACQTCHIPHRSVKAALIVASDVFNPGTKIPDPGKHLWTFYGPDSNYWNHYGELVMMGFDDKPSDLYTPTYLRYKGKIYPANRIHNSWPAIEVDGMEGLLQPKMGDVYKMWTSHQNNPEIYPSLSLIVDDNNDGVPEINRPEEIDALIQAITEMLTSISYPMDGKRVVWVKNNMIFRSGTDYRTIPTHDWEASSFANVHKYNHDVFPARSALGSNGCTDCHNPDSTMFFGTVLKEPFASDGNHLTQPQYELLGLNQTMVLLGAWRETYLKFISQVLVIILIVLLLVYGTQLFLGVVFSGRSKNIWIKIIPLLVGIYGLLVGGYLMLNEDLLQFMVPLRLWFENNHFLSSIVILSGGLLTLIGSLYHNQRQISSNGGKLLITEKYLMLTILSVVFFGTVMMFRIPALDLMNRISYTGFDASITLVLLGMIVFILTKIQTNFSTRKDL